MPEWNELLKYCLVFLEAGLFVVLVYVLKYLFAKGNLQLSEQQWTLIEKAVSDAIQYAEQVALNAEKKGQKMSSEEKLKLASELSDKLLTQLKLDHIKPLAVPLIEARLKGVLGNS